MRCKSISCRQQKTKNARNCPGDVSAAARAGRTEGRVRQGGRRAEGQLSALCGTHPYGRVDAIEKRLEATHGAAITVQPALTKFYDGLSDEQKARFNSLRADAAGSPP